MLNKINKFRPVFGVLGKAAKYAGMFLGLFVLLGLIAYAVGIDGLKAIDAWNNKNGRYVTIFVWIVYLGLAVYWKGFAQVVGKWLGDTWRVLLIEKWYLFAGLVVLVELVGLSS